MHLGILKKLAFADASFEISSIDKEVLAAVFFAWANAAGCVGHRKGYIRHAPQYLSDKRAFAAAGGRADNNEITFHLRIWPRIDTDRVFAGGSLVYRCPICAISGNIIQHSVPVHGSFRSHSLSPGHFL